MNGTIFTNAFIFPTILKNNFKSADNLQSNDIPFDKILNKTNAFPRKNAKLETSPDISSRVNLLGTQSEKSSILEVVCSNSGFRLVETSKPPITWRKEKL